ncbi:MAG: hypothetical protein ACON38_12355 [Akkermansiaceae bacterium]
MEKILLKDIPRKCPDCDAYLFTEAPRPTIGKRAWMVAAAGVLATGLWVFFFLSNSDYYITPGKPVGLVLCALIYGWPFYLSALAAWKLPLEVSCKCYQCKKRRLFQIENPKIPRNSS